LPVGEDHRRTPGKQAVGGRPWPAEPSLDRSLEPVADERRGQEGEQQDDRAAQVEGAQLFRDQPPLSDEQRRSATRVQRHLEALADLGVDRLPVPACEPGDEDDVGRAGDRQQLRRPLDDAEREGAPGGDHTVAGLLRRRLTIA